MKIVSRQIERNGAGTVALVPEGDEDLYHLYNLIQPGDLVNASTVRRLQSESSTGSIESQRVRLQLTINVTKLDFEMAGGAGMSNSAAPLGAVDSDSSSSAQSTPMSSQVLSESSDMSGSGMLSGASQGQPTLHLAGRVAVENAHVRTGSFHTLDIEVHRKLSITKESWDAQHLETLEESGEAGNTAEVGAVILGDGRATVCLLTNNMTIVRQRIHVPMPRKRQGAAAAGASSGTAKLAERFNTQVYAAVIKLLSLPAMRTVILASPAFWKDNMYNYLLSEAQRRGDKVLLGNEGRRKLLKVHAASTHVHALMDVLRSPEVAAQLQDTKFARETQLMDKFLRTLASDEMRAWYGEREIVLAAARGAIGSLLLSDAVLRTAHPQRRKQWVELGEQIRSFGGSVAIFSSLHESGRQLNGLGGVAALLTYPLDLDLVEEEEADTAADAAASTQS